MHRAFARGGGATRRRRAKPSLLALALGVALGATAPPAGADVPWPTCAAAGCADADDYASYLFTTPGQLPNDFDPRSGDAFKFQPVTGMDVVAGWTRTTGRPDVFVAVLDSGIRWDSGDITRKVALNAGELPPPPGCADHDCNGDGVFNVDDFAGAGVADSNGNGRLDGQDLIRHYSDGVDDDANGYVDDIAGWDFYQDDNDPDDDVDYGHGTGQAIDEVAEANNGGGFPGVAPSAMFLPLRVADSFIAIDSDFAQAMVYAVDRGAAVISEALGTLTVTEAAQAAIDYAYHRGIPLIASAADEESRHHNGPALLEHTIWVNSIRGGDGSLTPLVPDFALLNGCTNFGGKAWVAIPSTACSSEATGRAGGLAALLVSQGRNLMDRGELSPYPGLPTPFSAEEVRQLLRDSAGDLDFSANLSLAVPLPARLLAGFLSAPALGLTFASTRFPTQAGWDQYTGYGRPNAPRLLDVTEATLPPEADLSGSLRWFDTVDPVRTPEVPVVGSARAVRAGNVFDWELEAGCGVQPLTYHLLAEGSAAGPMENSVLARWRSAETAATCGFDPAEPIQDPDAHTVTLRLRVRDRRGNLGEDRRTVAIHRDPTEHFAPIALGSSGESPPVLADVNRDGTLDVVFGTGAGAVHALSGATGLALPGFPAHTAALPVHPSPAYESGEVPVPREAILGSAAADDLDGDGRVEIVVASIEGRVYVFDDHGRLRPGFPVTTDAAFSEPANRDRLNDTDPGIVSSPTLADLDAPGGDGRLEIVTAAWDGHLYAWRDDGTPVPGFPVRLADPERVVVDAATGRAMALPDASAGERAAKVLSSPAVGDLDGDGRPEIVVATNEEYGDSPDVFNFDSFLIGLLRNLGQIGIDVGDFSLDAAGRIYAVHADGNLHAGGPFVPGWPAPVPLLAPGLLPTVGTGTPGSPALADIDGSGRLHVAIFAIAGPVMLLDADGQPALGTFGGAPLPLAPDFPGGGFPAVPPTAGSADAPFFGALGSSAFGDLDGDGLPEVVAPTGGLRKLLDVAVPARQSFGDHQVTAWDPRSGELLPAFPRVMDDMQFLTSPALADVDGDGRAEIVQGSGAYLLRAYRADGSQPAGWPKFTHGWLIGTPAAGDVDGDGLVEIVALTREGNLYVWDTPAPAQETALPWSSFGRDRRNTQNLASSVAAVAAVVGALDALVWQLEALEIDLLRLAGELRRKAARRLRAAARDARRALAALEAPPGDKAGSHLHALARELEKADAPEADALAESLAAAVRAALARLLEADACQAADRDCARAQDSLARGDREAVRGRSAQAIKSWGKGIDTLRSPDTRPTKAKKLKPAKKPKAAKKPKTRS